MKIKIIECDELYPEFQSEYVSYGKMFEKYFRQIKPDLEFDYYYALDSRLPERFDQRDIFLITGSKSGVYEDQPWVTGLLAWIASAYASGSSLLGICFGHQALAAALGGNVVKSEKGWGVGVRSLRFHNQLPEWLDTQQDSLKLIYSHQDQVVKLPENARVLLSDDFCPYAAFDLNNQAVGFQGHPEFEAEYARRLLARRTDSIGETVFNNAMASLAEPTDAVTLGRKFISWFESKKR